MCKLLNEIDKEVSNHLMDITCFKQVLIHEEHFLFGLVDKTEKPEESVILDDLLVGECVI
jgi:hypothetical protein